jgi:predicted ferric reductase
MMSKQGVLKVVNPLLFAAWAVQAMTGVLLKAGILSFDSFRLVHPRVGYAVVVLGLIHLILNWSWIRSVLFGIRPKKPLQKAS